MWRIATIAALTWGTCGLLALLTLAGVMQNMVGVTILVMPAILIWSLGIEKVLPDSAHGPPFLTFAGIVVFYWVPTALLIVWGRRVFRRAEDRARSAKLGAVQDDHRLD